jgi:hypothetical protein
VTLGVHFSIDKETATRLLRAADDDELVAIVEQVEERWEEKRVFESDHAWDTLHRLLGDGSLDAGRRSSPLAGVFLGGQVLNTTDDYFVVLVKPDAVGELARKLGAVTFEWLRHRYATLSFPDYQYEKSDDDLAHAWETFQGLPDFFARAAMEKRYVIFTVSS